VDKPQVERIVSRGRLLNGNPGGDLSKSPRCGAKAKSTGLPCRAPGVKRPDGSYTRCRLHGARGGPKTPEGIQRIAEARTQHGYYSEAAIAERRSIRALVTEMRAAVADLGQAATSV
jgi:hypothetical protein